MLNKTIVMGRLTRDPEMRTTTSGIAVSRFTLAVERDFKQENGERAVDYLDCVAWRSTAVFVNKYFAKGRMAVVSGRLQSSSWTDNDGAKHRSTEINVEDIYFGEGKQREAAESSVPALSEITEADHGGV